MAESSRPVMLGWTMMSPKLIGPALKVRASKIKTREKHKEMYGAMREASSAALQNSDRGELGPEEPDARELIKPAPSAQVAILKWKNKEQRRDKCSAESKHGGTAEGR